MHGTSASDQSSGEACATMLRQSADPERPFTKWKLCRPLDA